MSKLTTRDKALRAMWSQGHTDALLDSLSEARVEAIAKLVDADSVVSPNVRAFVGGILEEHFAELKATTEETDAVEEGNDANLAISPAEREADPA